MADSKTTESEELEKERAKHETLREKLADSKKAHEEELEKERAKHETLREKLADTKRAHEEELEKERAKTEALRTKLGDSKRSERAEGNDKKKEAQERVRKTADSVANECNTLSRGVLYAGLEAIGLAADVTRTFVSETYNRNAATKRDTVFKQVVGLPWDMTEAFLDAFDESVSIPGKVVDKFYEKYKKDPS
jgi:predicted  nucleic acid-binding Zn-ribbon protein